MSSNSVSTISKIKQTLQSSFRKLRDKSKNRKGTLPQGVQAPGNIFLSKLCQVFDGLTLYFSGGDEGRLYQIVSLKKKYLASLFTRFEQNGSIVLTTQLISWKCIFREMLQQGCH